MSEFVNTIDLLGDEAVTKALIERTITEFHDDVVTYVGDSAFSSCNNLKSVYLPNVENVSDNCGLTMGSLEYLNLPKLKSIPSWAKLKAKYMYFESATSLGSNAFTSSSQTVHIYLPSIISLSYQAFSSCSALTTVEFSMLKNFYNGEFQNCKNLKWFIHRGEVIPNLTGVSTFNTTPFADGNSGGTLLVRRSNISEYQNHTNWSAILAYENNRILALEDYTIDGTITGEIDWDKLGGTT